MLSPLARHAGEATQVDPFSLDSRTVEKNQHRWDSINGQWEALKSYLIPGYVCPELRQPVLPYRMAAIGLPSGYMSETDDDMDDENGGVDGKVCDLMCAFSERSEEESGSRHLLEAGEEESGSRRRGGLLRFRVWMSTVNFEFIPWRPVGWFVWFGWSEVVGYGQLWLWFGLVGWLVWYGWLGYGRFGCGLCLACWLVWLVWLDRSF